MTRALSSLFLIFLTILQTTIRPVNAFCGKGAPGFGLHYETVCKHMLPVHKASIIDVNDGNKTINLTAPFAPASSCPYVIDVLKVTAPSGKSAVKGESGSDLWSITFKIRSVIDEVFQGYVIQARDHMDRPVGTFEVINRTTLTCDNDTLSQKGKHNHTEREFTWLSNSADFRGYIIFNATVLRNAILFWKVVSHPVYIGTPDFSGLMNKVTNISNDAHNYNIQWFVDQVAVHFKIRAKVEPNKYFAIALSKDAKMTDDSVVGCTQNGVRMSWNYVEENDLQNQMLKNPTYNLLPELSNVTYVDGEVICTFALFKTKFHRFHITTSSGNTDKDVDGSSSRLMKEKSAEDSAKVFFAGEGEYYILVASGSQRKGHLGNHEWATSHGPLTFSMEIVSEVGQVHKYNVKLHGVLMVIAWTFAASIAIILPRYFKISSIRFKIFDKPFWFSFHFILFMSAILLTIISFIVIFVEIGRYSVVHGIGSAHPILGIIVTVLIVINAVLAFFRCDIRSKNRWLFDLFHYVIGQMAYFLALITILLSVFLSKLSLPSWWPWVVMGHMGWQALIEFILYAIKFYKERVKTINRQNKENEEGEAKEPRVQVPAKLNSLPPRLLLVHAIGVIIFTIVISIGIYGAN